MGEGELDEGIIPPMNAREARSFEKKLRTLSKKYKVFP
jgi:hypothetical protein